MWGCPYQPACSLWSSSLSPSQDSGYCISSFYENTNKKSQMFIKKPAPKPWNNLPDSIRKVESIEGLSLFTILTSAAPFLLSTMSIVVKIWSKCSARYTSGGWHWHWVSVPAERKPCLSSWSEIGVGAGMFDGRHALSAWSPGEAARLALRKRDSHY